MLGADYLAGCADDIVAMYGELEIEILKDIARRIAKTGMITETAKWQIERLNEAGLMRDEIVRRISETGNLSKTEIESLFKASAIKTRRFDERIYNAAGLSPIPINQSPAMLQILWSGINKTNGRLQNLTKTITTTANDAFYRLSDLAYNQITSGAFTYQQAITNCCKQLSKEGLTVFDYASGSRISLEAGIRRLVLTGVNQTSGQLTEQTMHEMDVDLCETSAHGGARPDHALWQGKVFSLKGKTEKYDDFYTACDYGSVTGIYGANCRHERYPYFEGISNQNYTKQQLAALNEKTIKYTSPDGTTHEYTLYEAEQRQRAIERNIRKWKKEAAINGSADVGNTFAASKVKQWQAIQRDFIDQTGLKRDYFREKVYNGIAKDTKSSIIRLESPKYQYVPSKTINEANDYSRNVLGIDKASYKGVDITTANEWNRGLTDAFNKFPELKDNFGFIGECHERNSALKSVVHEKYLSQLKLNNPGFSEKDLLPYADRQTSKYMKQMSVSKDTFAQSFSPNSDFAKPFSGVTVNKNWGKDFNTFTESLKSNVTSKSHPVGCDTVKSVLDHEIGHQLDNMLEISKQSNIQNLYRSHSTAELTEKLSTYAWKNTNPNRYSEFIAEGWAEYLNNPNPRPIAKEIGETIERLYKQWKK